MASTRPKSTEDASAEVAASTAAPEEAAQVKSAAEASAAPSVPSAQERLNEYLAAGYTLADLAIVTHPDGSLKSVALT